MNQKSTKPVPKVGAMGISGVITTLIIWAMSEYGGVELPVEIVALLTAAISFVAGYVMPDKSSNFLQEEIHDARLVITALNKDLRDAHIKIRDDDNPSPPPAA